MTAVERLGAIEARARENWPTSEDVATLAAALRAVLALADQWTFKGRGAPDDMPDEVDYIHDAAAAAITAVITAALDPS